MKSIQQSYEAFFFLPFLTDNSPSKEIFALSFQDKYPRDFNLVRLRGFEGTIRKMGSDSKIGKVTIKSINYDREDEILEIRYTMQSGDRSFKTKIYRCYLDNLPLVDGISEILTFIYKERDLVFKNGLVDSLDSIYTLSHIGKENYIRNVFNLKTHSIEYAEARVGKDYISKSDVVIEYPFDSDRYFVKLLLQTVKGYDPVHNEVNRTIRFLDNEQNTAACPTLPERHENEWLQGRIKVIMHIVESFNLDDAIRLILLKA